MDEPRTVASRYAVARFSKIVYLERDEEAIRRERLHWWDGCIKPHGFSNLRSGQATGAHTPRGMSILEDSVGYR